MPPPVEPHQLGSIDRQCAALWYLSKARRGLIDAKPYLLGTDAGRNFDSLLSALESRIDRIRLHGLGAVESDPMPLIVEV